MNKIPNNIDQFTKHLTIVWDKQFLDIQMISGILTYKNRYKTRKDSCLGARPGYR